MSTIPERETEADKKRKRSQNSSNSELDISTDNLKTNSQKKKKKTKTKIMSIIEETKTKKDGKEEGKETFDTDKMTKALSEINEKLSNVYTKTDDSLQTIIKDIVYQMKRELQSSLEKRIEILEGKLFEKEDENDKLKQKVKQLNEKLEEQIQEETNMKREIKNMQIQSSEKINELEQYGRRNNIRMSGVGEKENETAEETTELVIKTINAHLGGLKLNRKDIDIAHRLGKRTDKPRQIIVKFLSRMDRDKVMYAKKNLKGTRIYVSEDLTYINQHVLACLRKKMCDEIEIAWSRQGRIMYKNKSGNIHELKYKDYQKWIDLKWPTE